ncbi:MAG: RecX family transcriptional regulator [Dysgonamonadaceae bacterium]|jgi:regulatory protein|nr:RecX family transcriptional regulator [Dysgonamonadaceae bacterium]
MENSKRIISSEQALFRVAHICAQKECCVYDIKRKLKNMGLPENEIEKIINKLTAEKYIDESRFTRIFINDKLRFNKWGERKIKEALRCKFVPKEIIENAFSEFSDTSLVESLPDLLAKKRKSIAGKSEYEINTKLIRFALGKGFTMDDVLKCLKNIDVDDFPDL